MTEYLVVLSVLEGRKFPKRDKCALVVEAFFDGETVQTDPTEHCHEPDFNTELTWHLDKKSLHMHRLQRSPLKIQCYVIPENGQKQLLGYVIIDIRLALEDAIPPKWHPILNSAYKKQKPELLIGLALEKHISNEKTAIPDVIAKEETKIKADGFSDVLKNLKLNEKDGLYEIGSQKNASLYCLTVTIACVQNINALISKDVLMDDDDELFFYYSLLGNDVTTDPFKNSRNPEFPAERASIKIRCTEDNVRHFFKNIPNLQIYLCCGDATFGRADLSLAPLVKDSGAQPKTIESLFELKNLDSETVNDEASKAYVGVSVTLRKEISSKNQPQPAKIIEDNRMENTKLDANQNQKPKSIETFRRDGSPGNVDNINDAPVEPSILDLRQDIRPSKLTLETDTNVTGNLLQKIKYCFTLDLRKITMHATPSLRCSLRYMYPFFGTFEPITSHPVFEVKPNIATTIPQGYCMFNFASSQQLLQDTFNSIPVVVELFHHGQDDKMELIGVAKLAIGPVLSTKSTPISNKEMNGNRRLHTCSTAIHSSQTKNKIGDIFVVMALDEFGALDDEEIEKLRTKKHQSGQSINKIQHKNESSDRGKKTMKADESISPKSSDILSKEAAIQVALELEAWREQQQILFRNQLKEKEQAHLAALSSEWISRDKEREQLLHKKLKDHETVECRLKEALNDVEKRQKKLMGYEQEVLTLRTELKQQKEYLSKNNADTIKRTQEECKLSVSIARKENDDLNKRIQILSDEKDALHKKLKLRDKEFESYKEDLRFKPEVKLQNELDIANLEKTELERKLEASTKSKIHYKQQWGRALRELSRIRQVQQEQARIQLQRQQEELEVLRMQHAVTESNHGMAARTTKDFEEIRSELTRLKDELRPVTPRQREAGEEDVRDMQDKSDRLTRLENERKMLLETGVYSMQDNIIQDMTRNIQRFKTALNQA